MNPIGIPYARAGVDDNGRPFVTCPICETHHYASRGAGTAVMVYARHYALNHQPQPTR